MEYASEAEAVEAAKKYQDVELDGQRLYVIKSMTDRMMSFGDWLFFCQLREMFFLRFQHTQRLLSEHRYESCPDVYVTQTGV